MVVFNTNYEILRNFVISNHENHTIFKKRNQRKFFSMDFNFKLTSNLKQILPEIPPNPDDETQEIGFSFPDP